MPVNYYCLNQTCLFFRLVKNRVLIHYPLSEGLLRNTWDVPQQNIAGKIQKLYRTLLLDNSSLIFAESCNILDFYQQARETMII